MGYSFWKEFEFVFCLPLPFLLKYSICPTIYCDICLLTWFELLCLWKKDSPENPSCPKGFVDRTLNPTLFLFCSCIKNVQNKSNPLPHTQTHKTCFKIDVCLCNNSDWIICSWASTLASSQQRAPQVHQKFTKFFFVFLSKSVLLWYTQQSMIMFSSLATEKKNYFKV